MTPDKAAGHLTDAWLSEMWPTVRQYRQGAPDRPKVKAPRKPRETPTVPREECPLCGVDFQSAYLVEHIIRRHPEAVQKPGDKDETGGGVNGGNRSVGPNGKGAECEMITGQGPQMKTGRTDVDAPATRPLAPPHPMRPEGRHP